MNGRRDSRRSTGKIYCSDRKLIPRIKQCIEGEEYDKWSVDDLVQHLQSTYQEYGRKKKNTFRIQIDKIYKQLMFDESLYEDYEKDYLKRNEIVRNGEEIDGFELTSDSEIEMIQASAANGNTNMMNDLLTDIYAPKSQPQTPIPVSQGLVPKPVSINDDQLNVNQDESDIVRKRPKSDNSKSAKKRRKQTKTDGEIIEDIKAKFLNDISVIHPISRFTDFGGCDTILKDVGHVLVQFQHPEIFTHLGVSPPQGFLLHGPPGSGKSLLAHAIAGELSWPMISITSTEVISGVSGESEDKIRNLFRKAKETAPCVLFIDDIDAITPKRELAHREMERRIVTQLISCMDDLKGDNNGCGQHVLVIGATSRVESLDPSLRRSGRFDREILLGIPDEKARSEIIKVLIRLMKVDEDVNIDTISHLTPGYVGADLTCLIREAALCAVNRILMFDNQHETLESIRSKLNGGLIIDTELLQSVTIMDQDFKIALTQVVPSAKREGFATVPDTTWNDIGALSSIREELTMAILAPVRYPDQFTRLGLKQPPGILLAGPPGCGKTLLAKAIANESGINFISIKGPELLNMYVGESERAVRQVFQRARNSSPCVIFFDEIDALCPRRSDVAETSSSARVVNQLLTEMDGLESRKQVFLMGATNRPDIIDPAILRPGRLDKILYVGLPDSTDRFEILNTITKKGTIPPLASDVDLSVIAQDVHSKGYSGADLAALIREAASISLKEFMSLTHSAMHDTTLSLLPDNSDQCVVSKRHFNEALTKVQPSVTNKEIARYSRFHPKPPGDKL